MRRIALITGMVMAAVVAVGQIETRALKPNVHTLRTTTDGGTGQQFPCVKLGGEESVTFSFDCLDEGVQNYTYRVISCNADWKPSELSEVEWCAGYAENDIKDYGVSRNTHQSYVHYTFTLPNEDCQFKRSGNYGVVVYESGDESNVVASFRMYVTEQSAVVSGKVNGETRKELNGRYQEIRFDVNMEGVAGVVNPSEQMKVFLTQNDRADAERRVPYTGRSGDKYQFRDKECFIFEGGREFHSVDFSSRYTYGNGIEQIKYYDPYYHVTLSAIEVPEGNVPYEYRFDTNGRYVIHEQEWDDDDVTSDYFLVHFFLKTDRPMFDSKVYVLGGFNEMRADDNSRMIYNARMEGYERTVLLKQGGYGYLIASVKKGGKEASFLRTEGSYWQTENEYRIKVYYRAIGDRADRLLTVSVINSR